MGMVGWKEKGRSHSFSSPVKTLQPKYHIGSGELT
jgi:hypothetical protein